MRVRFDAAADGRRHRGARGDNYEHPAVKAVSKSLETVENLFASSSSSSPKAADARETASLASSRHRSGKHNRHMNSLKFLRV